MVSAETLALQGSDIRQVQSTTQLLRIIAKTIGSVGSLTGGNAPALTRQQWITNTSDLEGVAESDLLAFIADQLARVFMQGGDTGLNIAGDEVFLDATQTTIEGVTANIIGSTELRIADPSVVAGTATSGAPLRLTNATTGQVAYGPVSETFQLVGFAAVSASRNIANSDLGLTLLYSGTSNITLTIPSGLVSGLKFRVIQGSTGKVTIAGSGVTVNGKNGHLSTGGAWHVIDVVQAGATQFVVYGDTAA